MTVATVRIRMRLPSRTLKEKRTIVKSTVERLRNRFNASVTEVDDLDDPGTATIAAACLANERAHAEEQVAAIVSAVREWRVDAEVLEIETDSFQA